MNQKIVAIYGAASMGQELVQAVATSGIGVGIGVGIGARTLTAHAEPRAATT